jgi:hypothetical protein
MIIPEEFHPLIKDLDPNKISFCIPLFSFIRLPESTNTLSPPVTSRVAGFICHFSSPFYQYMGDSWIVSGDFALACCRRDILRRKRRVGVMDVERYFHGVTVGVQAVFLQKKLISEPHKGG